MTAIKRQIAFAFSTTSMRDFEAHVDLTVENFMSKLRRKEGVVDLVPMFAFYAFDSICRLAFSDALGKQSEAEAVMKGAKERFKYWFRWGALPETEELLFKNSFIKGVGTPNALGQLAQSRFADRLEKGGAGVHHDLLDRLFQAQKADPSTFNPALMIGISISMIHAGSETTGHTLANVFWELLKNPQHYQRLVSEIRGASWSSPPTLAEARRFPFIEACVKEAGRLHNLFADPLERVVPASGLQIGDTFLPGGTVIGKCEIYLETTMLIMAAANTRALSFNTSVFGADAHQFNPERFLNASPAQLATMERTNFHFSQGKRNCIGMNIAWMEMLKLIPAIVKEFDVSVLAGCTDVRLTA
jgi:cytochrome P450